MNKTSLLFATISACIFLSCADAAAPRENPRNNNVSSRANEVRPGTSSAQPTQSRSATTPRANVSRAAVAARSATTSPRLEAARAINNRQATRPEKNPNEAKPRGIVARTAVATASFGSAEYNQCKDAYAACMTQFCAGDERFGKCMCSNKSIDLKARLEAAESAIAALEAFATKDMAAVGLDAGAAAAMFAATEGELAIPQDGDSSDIFKRLEAIGDSIGGGKTAGGKTQSRFQMTSLNSGGDMFSIDSLMDDMFGGKGGGSVDVNLTGDALYNNVHAQCGAMLKDVCSSKNLALAVSLYKQDINKDCDRMDKAIKGKEDQIRKGVLDANVMLMEQRLDDYESRNSLSDLECLDEAMKTMTNENVCGAGWVRCLDFTGQFMKYDGTPLYTALFPGIQDALKLPDANLGHMTLLDNPENRQFILKLEEKRMHLDGKGVFGKCRDGADRVWRQVLERSLLEIKSAQREKVELVKDECISKLATCMDVQTGALDGLGDLLSGNAPTTQAYQTTPYGVSAPTALATAQARSGESIALAEIVCEDIRMTCNKVFGPVFEQYMNSALSQTRIKAMCTTNLGGKWEVGADGVQRCNIDF
ncbi:MAG: hypothetical protein LBG89_03990 [Rickettsiales bacterium]|jgi:hypothetical protein|nr:hypothetical protein [Rickettsiales bacterium]